MLFNCWDIVNTSAFEVNFEDDRSRFEDHIDNITVAHHSSNLQQQQENSAQADPTTIGAQLLMAGTGGAAASGRPDIAPPTSYVGRIKSLKNKFGWIECPQYGDGQADIYLSRS